jgi:hypothetical protein
MYYSYVEIEYVATSFSPAKMDLAVKLLIAKHRRFLKQSQWEHSHHGQLPIVAMLNRVVLVAAQHKTLHFMDGASLNLRK